MLHIHVFYHYCVSVWKGKFTIIYLYIWRLTPSRSVPLAPRGWPWQKSLHLSLFEHYVLACWNLMLLVAPLSHMYFFTLSFHLPSSFLLLFGPIISLTYISFTNFSLFIFSIHSDQLKVFLYIHSTTSHFIPFAWVPIIFHTHFHFFHHLILSLHMPLSSNSFPQHAVLTAVFYSTSESLIHTSELPKGYYSLNLSFYLNKYSEMVWTYWEDGEWGVCEESVYEWGCWSKQ